MLDRNMESDWFQVEQENWTMYRKSAILVQQ